MSALTTTLDKVLGSQGRHELDITRPEPVIDEAKAKAKVAAGITTGITFAGAAGVSATDLGLLATVLTVLAGALIAVTNAVLTIRAAYAARVKVTPNSDPRAADGTLLTEVPGSKNFVIPHPEP